MSRNFTGVNTDRLDVANGIVTAVPITMACWFKPVSASANYTLMCNNDNTTTNRIRLSTGSGGSAGSVLFATGAGSGSSSTSTSFSAAAWSHACGVSSGVASRAVYLNGGGKGTNTVSVTPTGINQFQVGIAAPNTGQFFNGDMAEVAIWNIALSDAEAASLATGISPLLMHPESLKFYAPLLAGLSPEIDLMQANSLTVTGTTFSAHTRVSRPRRHRIFSKVPAVTAITFHDFVAGLQTPYIQPPKAGGASPT